MVDIAGLPTDQLTAADFEFRVGNSNAPGTWTTAAAPTSISVRLGAGVSGSARVEIIWPDGAIQKEWLQVTVKATPNTGLTTADVFYFGNAVGETGNAAADAIVDAVDCPGAQNNPARIRPRSRWPTTSIATDWSMRADATAGHEQRDHGRHGA